MNTNFLDKNVTLENLTEGDIINVNEYINKLKAFKLLGVHGTYVVTKVQ